jgi:asparagine synthase (glutamine-hydrolysing)
MCGIAGQVRSQGRVVEEVLVHRMCAAQEHRGPDSRGVHVEPGVGLGIQRLRIIDLTTGDQPIFNEDGNVVVVLNGEIYNFRELRHDLEAQGHVFRTRSDTETIVHLYERDGLDFVRHLHGMFGIALWDRARQQLVLARDRAGKKPLFYAERDGVLSFASELPALLQDSEIDRELDPQALDAYLAYRYVPSPLCSFRAVRKLSPGSALVFREGRSTVSRYWTLDFSSKRSFTGDAEMLGELREHLRQAVRRRMISDVPIGAFLSGGIDSATVVALMAEASSQPVKTFSIGFRSELDELPLARTLAERFGTDHHELVVEPKAIEIIPKIIEHHGEPFADATSVPTFYLAELAREHVTVALNGDGGDELFAGYTRYVANLAASKLDPVPPTLRRAAGRLALTLPPSGRINSTRSRVRRLGATLALSPLERYIRYTTDLQGFARERVYTDEFRSQIGRSVVPDVIGNVWRASSVTNIVDHMLEADTAKYLPDDLLAKVDIATMAASLEGRLAATRSPADRVRRRAPARVQAARVPEEGGPAGRHARNRSRPNPRRAQARLPAALGAMAARGSARAGLRYPARLDRPGTWLLPPRRGAAAHERARVREPRQLAGNLDAHDVRALAPAVRRRGPHGRECGQRLSLSRSRYTALSVRRLASSTS